MSEISHASTSGEKKDIFYYINVIIMLLLMFGFPHLEPMGPLSQQGMQAVGIFLGLLWAWTFVDFIWPSILGMVAIGLTGYMTIDQAFASGFGNATTLTIVFVFALAAYMTSTGVCKTVAYWFVSRKSCIGRPYLFMFYLFLACYILGATAGTVATYVMGWAVIYEIAHISDYKMGDSFPASLLVGAVFSAMLGATVFPFRPFAVISLNNSKQILGMDCTFMDWAIPSFAASFGAMVVYVLVIRFVIRPDVSKLKAQKDIFSHFRNQVILTKDQKVAFVTMIAIILFASIPSFLPAGSAARTWLSNFTIGPIIALVMGITYAIHRKGKPLMDYAKAMSDGIDWQTIIMLAASMPLATLIQDKNSGVTTLINDFLTMFLGDYSPFMISCLFIIFTVIVTQVAHNMVMMVVLAPIICNLSLAMGFNPMPCLMMLAFAANTGIATPGASVMGAMIFANRKWIPIKDAFGYTWLAVVASGVTMCVLGIPLAFFVNAGMVM